MRWEETKLKTGENVKYQQYSDFVEYFGTRNNFGLTVNTFEGCFENVPFVGEFDTYEGLAKLADGFKRCGIKNFVVHMRHSRRNAYVLHTEDGKNIFVRI